VREGGVIPLLIALVTGKYTEQINLLIADDQKKGRIQLSLTSRLRNMTSRLFNHCSSILNPNHFSAHFRTMLSSSYSAKSSLINEDKRGDG